MKAMNPRRTNARITLSVRVDKSLVDRVRECVRENAGKPLYLRMGSFVSDALEAHLAATERKLEAPERDTRRISNNSR